MPESKNSIVDLKKYLGTKERPVDHSEMNEFWKSLTEEEKEEFKNAELE